jgi:potassium/sodium efflux P-type ATPase
MVASEFDRLSDRDIDAFPELPLVLARCTPQTKVKLIHALHRRNKYVAMTGDGVNDAPAVKNADVGIAMGLGGSDVTKQASDITLTDDNFSSIVKAVAEGRRLFSNIRKFTLHLLSGNVSEVVILILGLAIKDASGTSIFPMSPIQILYLNMITSSPIALALGAERASSDLMRVPPSEKGRQLWNRELFIDTLFYGCLMGMLSLGNFLISIAIFNEGSFQNLPVGCNEVKSDSVERCSILLTARGVSFISLSLFLLIHGLNCRHPNRSMFAMRFFSNRLLVLAIALGIVVTLPTCYIPFLNYHIFSQRALGLIEWGLILGGILLFILLSEMYKFVKRRKLYLGHPHGLLAGSDNSLESATDEPEVNKVECLVIGPPQE